jgi:hypothetical protein
VCSDLHPPEMATTWLHSDLVPLKHPVSPALVLPTSDSHPRQCAKEHEGPESEDDQLVNPNVNAFSAALTCYPYALSQDSICDCELTRTGSVVKEIARSVDLNTLHALSMTCRQFHANLIPFRNQLVRETLRCKNESVDQASGTQQVPKQGSWDTAKLTSEKVGRCARDMVSECQKCGGIVCRVYGHPGASLLLNMEMLTKYLFIRTVRSNHSEMPCSRAASVGSAPHVLRHLWPTIFHHTTHQFPDSYLLDAELTR